MLYLSNVDFISSWAHSGFGVYLRKENLLDIFDPERNGII